MEDENTYRAFVDALDCTNEESISVRIQHAILGIVGEAGELADVVKKRVYYNTITLEEYQKMLKDEAGDLFFYLTDLTTLLGIDFSELADRNAIKLRHRYPDGTFSKDKVINKDKEAEQRAVDGEHHPGCTNNDLEDVR